MKQVAVVVYDGYCLFEVTVALEMLAMQQIPITIFGEEKKSYRSEEGMLVVAEHTLEELKADQFDAIILSGFMNGDPTIVKNEILKEKLKEFDQQKKVIAAISIAPIMLLNAGLLQDKHFMIGALKQDLMEEGYSKDELKLMIDWEECCANPNLDFIKEGHIITSVAYKFREWAMEIGRMLDIEIYPGSFGLPKE